MRRFSIMPLLPRLRGGIGEQRNDEWSQLICPPSRPWRPLTFPSNRVSQNGCCGNEQICRLSRRRPMWCFSGHQESEKRLLVARETPHWSPSGQTTDLLIPTTAVLRDSVGRKSQRPPRS